MEGYWFGEGLSPSVYATENVVISRNKIFSMSTSLVIYGMWEVNCTANLVISTYESKYTSPRFSNVGSLPEYGQHALQRRPVNHIILPSSSS